jgi:hypothetical protein
MSTHASDGADFDLKWHQILLDHWRSELQAGHYLTNDIVELTGGFTGNLRFLRINGGRPMKINRAEFQILAVIMAQNRTARGLTTPRTIQAQAHYLTGQEIISALDEWEKQVPGAGWHADPAGVFKVISKLRKKLARKKHPLLLETMDQDLEGGYRLSTPPLNLVLQMRPPSPPTPPQPVAAA